DLTLGRWSLIAGKACVIVRREGEYKAKLDTAIHEKANHCEEMMLPLAARPDRASLIAALAARRLDRTLTSSLPPIDPRDEYSIGATNIPSLDAQLGGGFPRGQLSELVGGRSSGRTSLVLRMMAAATARGELVA